MEFKDLPEWVQQLAAESLKALLAAEHHDEEAALSAADGIREAFVKLFSDESQKLGIEKHEKTIMKIIAHSFSAEAEASKKSWSVMVLDEHGRVAWHWNVADGIDNSGEAWKNGNHCIMAAVHYSLRHAINQVSELPEEKEWRYPFSICPGSKDTLWRCGQRTALGESHKVPCEHSRDHCQHRKNNNFSSCD